MEPALVIPTQFNPASNVFTGNDIDWKEAEIRSMWNIPSDVINIDFHIFTSDPEDLQALSFDVTHHDERIEFLLSEEHLPHLDQLSGVIYHAESPQFHAILKGAGNPSAKIWIVAHYWGYEPEVEVKPVTDT